MDAMNEDISKHAGDHGLKDHTYSMKKVPPRNNRMVLGGGSPVAFHAVIPGAGLTNLGQGQKIVFDQVNLNLGGGYHNQHGLFIAPTSGIYIFSTSILSAGTEDLSVLLMQNGMTLAASFAQSGAKGGWDQGSVTLTAQVAVGDELWVQHRYGTNETIEGGYYSSFTGCLVFPL